MASKKPRSLKDLFQFYYDDVKPLYGLLQSFNEPPEEMFFEINAAFDHLSRHWHYGETEAAVVNSASAHLKRACFDAFKILVRETVDHYNELRATDTSIIDNGDFDRGMRRLIADIRAGSIEARQAEGDSRDEAAWHKAYELYEPVYVKCVQFGNDYYLNSKVEWVRKKAAWKTWRYRLEGVAISVIAGLIVWAVTTATQGKPAATPGANDAVTVVSSQPTTASVQTSGKR